MDMKKGSFFACLILFLVLLIKGPGGRRGTKDFLLGSRDSNLIVPPQLHEHKGMMCGSEVMTSLSPEIKHAVSKCLIREGVPFDLSEDDYRLKKAYMECLELVLCCHPVRKRHLADQPQTLIHTTSPSARVEQQTPIHTLPRSSDLAPASDKYLSVLPSDIFPQETSKKIADPASFSPEELAEEEKESVIIAVVLSSAGTSLILACVFCCYQKCCRETNDSVNGRDESPLLRLSLSDRSGSSNKSLGPVGSSNMDQVGSLQLKNGSSQNGHVFSLDVNSDGSSISDTPSGYSHNSSFGLKDASESNAPLPPLPLPPGRAALPPLPPPPGRALPPLPPPPGRATLPPLPPPPGRATPPLPPPPGRATLPPLPPTPGMDTFPPLPPTPSTDTLSPLPPPPGGDTLPTVVPPPPAAVSPPPTVAVPSPPPPGGAPSPPPPGGAPSPPPGGAPSPPPPGGAPPRPPPGCATLPPPAAVPPPRAAAAPAPPPSVMPPPPNMPRPPGMPPPMGGAPPPPLPNQNTGARPPPPPGCLTRSSKNVRPPPNQTAQSNKAKLKPLFWDKVLANSDQSNVWHQIRSGSFQFDEEMIESLFGFNAAKSSSETKKGATTSTPPVQYIQLLDPKKSQNLAISLKALSVKKQEVCDALIEGNELPPALLQTLLKMQPTSDEELKLRLYTGDLSQLGPAEQFLKGLVDIPFAYKRMDTLLFMASLHEDVSGIKESFSILEVACTELRSNRLFLKLLEAVLKTGNRMNDGTYRGGAQAFKLDTLLKLSDVKGADGKTTLLHFVVQEIIRSEGVRAVRLAKQSGSLSSFSINSDDLSEDSPRESLDDLCSLGLKVVSNLGSELENVKKAAILDADVITTTVASFGRRLVEIQNFLNIDMKNLEENSGFYISLKCFVEHAESAITFLLEEERRIRLLVQSTTDYFHGNAGKDEGLRLFIIVRDFLGMLDKACKEVREAPKKAPKTQKEEKDKVKESPTATPAQPDPRQLLFPAVSDPRVDSSSSDDEG